VFRPKYIMKLNICLLFRYLLAAFIATVISSEIFLPIFYRLRLSSTFEVWTPIFYLSVYFFNTINHHAFHIIHFHLAKCWI